MASPYAERVVHRHGTVLVDPATNETFIKTEPKVALDLLYDDDIDACFTLLPRLIAQEGSTADGAGGSSGFKPSSYMFYGAARHKRADVVRALVGAGVKPGKNGRSHPEVDASPIDDAILEEDMGALEALLDGGCVPTPADVAAALALNRPAFLRRLPGGDAAPEEILDRVVAEDRDGAVRALYLAAWRADAWIVRHLLDAGVWSDSAARNALRRAVGLDADGVDSDAGSLAGHREAFELFATKPRFAKFLDICDDENYEWHVYLYIIDVCKRFGFGDYLRRTFFRVFDTVVAMERAHGDYPMWMAELEAIGAAAKIGDALWLRRMIYHCVHGMRFAELRLLLRAVDPAAVRVADLVLTGLDMALAARLTNSAAFLEDVCACAGLRVGVARALRLRLLCGPPPKPGIAGGRECDYTKKPIGGGARFSECTKCSRLVSGYHGLARCLTCQAPLRRPRLNHANGDTGPKGF